VKANYHLRIIALMGLVFVLTSLVISCKPGGTDISQSETAIVSTVAPIETLAPPPAATLTPVPIVTTSSTTYRDSRLGIAFDYPSGWHLQDAPAGPVDVLLTSYEPASPPHKLEWNATTVSIGIRSVPTELTSNSLDTWVENTKQEAIAAHLTIFAEERLTLATGLPAAHITVVSGSGGMVEYVLVMLDGHPFEIVVQGNFALAKAVLDTLRSHQ
jgi:hypothetical protein